jgi:hypothetical protein
LPPQAATAVIVVTTLDKGLPLPSSSLIVVAIVNFLNGICFVLCGTNLFCVNSQVGNTHFLGVDTSFGDMGGKY